MKTNTLMWICVLLFVLGLSLGGSLAFAEDGDSDPVGWSKGEKNGWTGDMPSGLEKKETGENAKKVEREMHKAERRSEKKAEKQKMKIKRKIEKQELEAENEAQKKQREAEKIHRKTERETEKMRRKAERKMRRTNEPVVV